MLDVLEAPVPYLCGCLHHPPSRLDLDPNTMILHIHIAVSGPEARVQQSVTLQRPRSTDPRSKSVPNPPPVVSNLRYKIEDDHLAVSTGAGEQPQATDVVESQPPDTPTLTHNRACRVFCPRRFITPQRARSRRLTPSWARYRRVCGTNWSLWLCDSWTRTQKRC